MKQARALDPSPAAVGDLLRIADLIFEGKDFKTAKEVYEMVLTTKKDLDTVHQKLGLCDLSLGQKEPARKEFEKGLSINPGNKELKENLEKL